MMAHGGMFRAHSGLTLVFEFLRIGAVVARTSQPPSLLLNSTTLIRRAASTETRAARLFGKLCAGCASLASGVAAVIVERQVAPWLAQSSR
eukprot:SAG11_NODE_1939_length_4028_cov_1.658946_3_plen_91_part_00